MRPFYPLALTLALALPAAGQSPSYPLLAQCLGNENGVRAWYHALAPEERASFDALYSAYAANVKKRNGDQWSHGWLGNFWTHYVNDVNANGSIVGLFKEADTWTDSRTKLEKEALPQAQRAYGQAKAALDRAPDNARLKISEANAHERLVDLQELASRQGGTCSDWAADTKEVLTAVAQPHFTIATEVHTSVKMLGDSGAHMYVKACRKSGADCIVFDPWKRGYPELTTVEEQAKGSSFANSCFSVNKPVD
jgi:hypothetical protein